MEVVAIEALLHEALVLLKVTVVFCQEKIVQPYVVYVPGVVTLKEFLACTELGADRVPSKLPQLDSMLRVHSRASVELVDEGSQLG